MPAWTYTARSSQGKEARGLRIVESEAALAQILAEEGLFLIKARPARAERRPPASIRLSAKDLSTFLLHLATYLEVGLPLMAALNDYRDPRRPHLEAAVAEMATRMYEGAPLSEVMAAFPGMFKPVHVAMVRAGEASGSLDRALRAVIQLVEWEDRFRRQVRKAATYPAILLTLLFLIGGVMIVFGLPNILKLLEELNVPLPLVTRVFLVLGKALSRFGWILVVVPLALRLGLPVLLRRPALRLRWDTALLSLPVLGPLIQRIGLAQFSRFLAQQYQAGIPLVQALRNSEAVTGNACLAQAIRTMANGVAQGGRLAVMAARTGQFPDLVLRLLAIGEETGNLEEVLDRAAKRIDEEVAERVALVFQVLDPAIMVTMACSLVFVALAIMLPLYSMIGGLNA